MMCAGGEGQFFYPDKEDDADDESDVFFRIEAHFRRNGFPLTGDGVFVDNLELRLRVSDTAVYATNLAGALTTVSATNYDRAVAPGGIVAAIGSGFAANAPINVAAAVVPLPTTLNNIHVAVNGIDAPLFFVGIQASGAFQINYQLPFETVTGTALVEVFNGTRLVATEFLTVTDEAPGTFTSNASGSGQAVALNQNFTVNSAARPEQRGRFVIVYATGQGGRLLDGTTRELRRLPSGVATPSEGLYVTANAPTVTVGGVRRLCSWPFQSRRYGDQSHCALERPDAKRQVQIARCVAAR